jgi:hypothetical protein
MSAKLINCLTKSTSLPLAFVILLYTHNAAAQSECRVIADRAFMNSDLAPTYLDPNHPEKLDEILSTMQNGEIFCKRAVQAMKSGKVSADVMREKNEKSLKEAQEQYQKDGNMDALEFQKMAAEILNGAIKIAEIKR